MHLNNNKVALGYLDLTSYSDTSFRLRFEAEYDTVRNEIKSLSYASGEATATNGVFTITINYKNSFYRATLVISDTPATVQYTSYMQDKEQVNEATWNKYFKNHDFDNSEGFIVCFNSATEFKYITYKDNKVKIRSGTQGSEGTTLYYYKNSDSTNWRFIYCKEDYGWVETNDGTFNMDKLYRMCLFDLDLEFSIAQFWENYYWMYNVKSYEKAHFYFQYQTLERIELYQQIGSAPEVFEYRFTDISDIEFPEIDVRF